MASRKPERGSLTVPLWRSKIMVVRELRSWAGQFNAGVEGSPERALWLCGCFPGTARDFNKYNYTYLLWGRLGYEPPPTLRSDSALCGASSGGPPPGSKGAPRHERGGG